MQLNVLYIKLSTPLNRFLKLFKRFYLRKKFHNKIKHLKMIQNIIDVIQIYKNNKNLYNNKMNLCIEKNYKIMII